MKKTPILLAMMIIATGQVGVSIYLPSLPMISASLNVQPADVQIFVTLFLVGFGASQLVYGPLSDAIGRRPVFLLGQGIYLFGTLICLLFSDNLWLLVFGRLLQGLGAGSASVLGRSVLRDSYDGAELTKALSYLSVTASIMPVIAPIFGGWVAFYLGWQAVLTFVLIYLAAIFTLGYFVLPETVNIIRSDNSIAAVINNYAKLITNSQVLSSASYNWITYLACVVSLSVMPFILQHQLGLSVAQYGAVMVMPSAGLLIGTLLLNVLNRYLTTGKILGLSIIVMWVSGVWLVSNPLSLFNLVVAFTGMTIAQGLSFPLSLSLLLGPHKTQAGSVSALSGSIQMGIAGVLGGYLVEHWIDSQWGLGILYIVLASIMALVLCMSRLRKNPLTEFA
ncbi:multidrug effflux MFS transporter [Vibrio ostreicida]|uniref:Multidrug effflux MFS transporter n=1 Tax=Vibrio ostreicida TaxID=526588 RepID=A0ABT8BZ15_9VIBR|nr:multidrug effflux MFS transporter [Vibrio ostreicida]MDN3612407.1 multidrug effflux MFS transporter [Vibrio ostreicida]NPD09824.1 multidrug effflux MFS transporter [Vibrio ostreicida]